jgi:hypothetical protein
MKSLAFKTGVAVVAVVCLCTLFLAASARSSRMPGSSVAGQGWEKVVETGPPIFNEPVKIVGVMIKGRHVKFAEKFTGDDGWLKGAKFRLKNVTGKKIVFIELDVNFPETRTSGAEMSYRINLGQIPNINHPAAPLSVASGGEVEADIDEKRYGNLLKLIEERHSISNISKSHVQVGFVVFDDGTAWSAGSFYRQDPNNPKRWIPVNG